MHLRQVNAFKEDLSIITLEENSNIYAEGIMGLLVDYFIDLMPGFIIRGADITTFLV